MSSPDNETQVAFTVGVDPKTGAVTFPLCPVPVPTGLVDISKHNVEITCELAFSDGYDLTHGEAEIIRKALAAAVAGALPHWVRACWVHKGIRVGEAAKP